jgi:hypothetical protein
MRADPDRAPYHPGRDPSNMSAQHTFPSFAGNTSPQVLSLLVGLLMVCGCRAAEGGAGGSPVPASARAAAPSTQPKQARMWMTVGERRFAVTLADTAAATAFARQLPLTLDMGELNGNEKHATLPKALPADASRPGTLRNGDLMLYGTDTLVVFYLTFASPYAYTRIGRVDDPAALPRALGSGDARVGFSRD